MNFISSAKKLLIWTFCGFILFIVGIGTGSYLTAQKWQLKALKADEAAEKRLNEETEKVIAITRKMQSEKTALIQKHIAEAKNAKLENDRLRTSVRNGTLRLSVPTSALCATTVSGNTGTRFAEKGTELDAETSLNLLSIANDGDDAIRELNLCIDQYNAVKSISWKRSVDQPER